jgi:hypothetical protein
MTKKFVSAERFRTNSVLSRQIAQETIIQNVKKRKNFKQRFG